MCIRTISFVSKLADDAHSAWSEDSTRPRFSAHRRSALSAQRTILETLAVFVSTADTTHHSILEAPAAWDADAESQNLKFGLAN